MLLRQRIELDQRFISSCPANSFYISEKTAPDLFVKLAHLINGQDYKKSCSLTCEGREASRVLLSHRSYAQPQKQTQVQAYQYRRQTIKHLYGSLFLQPSDEIHLSGILVSAPMNYCCTDNVSAPGD